MQSGLPTIVPYVLAWFGVLAGIWALFDRAETVLRKDVRTNLSQWLQSNHSDTQSWPETFANIFDHVFGEKHLSFKCFFRSCLASIFSVAIFTLILTTTQPGVLEVFKDEASSNILDFLFMFLFVTFALNLIPDYLSLLETRLVLKYMRGMKVFGRFIALLTDLVITALIFSVALIVWITVATGDLEILPVFYEVVMRFTEVFSRPEDNNSQILLIWLFSTFTTSIWIWVFVLSSLIVKGILLTGISIRWLGRYFDIDNKPLKTLGFICMIFTTLAFVIYFPFL